MAKAGKTPPQRIDTAGGAFLGLPAAVLESAAWKHGADFRMQAIVLAVARCWTGYNNGTIAASARDIADMIGSHNNPANARSMRRAIGRGLLVCERVYPKAQRRANEYRLPWAATGKHPNFQPATHDYRAWSPADERDETKRQSFKSPVPDIDTGLCRISTQARKQPVQDTDTGGWKLPYSPVSDFDTHIEIPSPPHSFPNRGNSGGPSFIKPQSMTDDAWLLAQRRAANNPAMPDSDHVKALAIDWLSRAGRGGQSQLTRALGVPPSTLSKFLTKGAPLPERYRMGAVAWLVASGAKRAKAA